MSIFAACKIFTFAKFEMFIKKTTGFLPGPEEPERPGHFRNVKTCDENERAGTTPALILIFLQLYRV
jgi:hypothetical protein